MKKQMTFLLLTFFFFTSFGILTGYTAQEDMKVPSEEMRYNQEGMAHFKKGFYDLAPHHKKEEANREYGLAIQKFRKALAVNPSFSEAHKNLARVYYIQQKFLQAAEQYKCVTDLNPEDIDSYVLTALSYAEAGKFTESRMELEEAKKATTDKEILNRLNRYLEKLEQREKKVVR